MKYAILILLFCGIVVSSCLVVKPPKGVATKTDTLILTHVDSSQVIRYDTILHRLDTTLHIDSITPKFTDSLSMINYLKSQLESKNGQILSLTDAIKQLKPQPCTSIERTIEKQAPEQSTKDFINYIILGVIGIISIQIAKHKGNGHPQ